MSKPSSRPPSHAAAFHDSGQRFDDGEGHHSYRGVAERLSRNRLPRRGKRSQVEEHVQTHEDGRVHRCRGDKYQQPRQRRGDDELLADHAGEKADNRLRQPANASILERSLLLNTLVERKSVSWTRIFADLEAVMPPNVRLIQVRLPQIDSRNQVLLDMVVGSQSPEPVITFLKQLQASPRFGPATVHNSAPPTDNEPLYRYRVSVNYAQKL